MLNWLNRLYRKLRGIHPATLETSLPLEDGLTREDAITITVAGFNACLEKLGEDPINGNMEHHFHEFDGIEVLHSRWIHDAIAAQRDADGVEVS